MCFETEWVMNPTLLIADSDPEVRDQLQRLFINRGYQVETAWEALECLNKLRRLRPESLVLERELPWGGGAGVLGMIAEEQDVHAGIVLLTSGGTGDLSREVVGAIFDPKDESSRLVDLLADIDGALALKAEPPSAEFVVYTEGVICR